LLLIPLYGASPCRLPSKRITQHGSRITLRASDLFHLRFVGFVAHAAASLVRAVSNFDLRVPTRDPLRVVRGPAAPDTHRMHLRHVLGDGEQLRHWPERAAQVILIEARYDHSNAGVCK